LNSGIKITKEKYAIILDTVILMRMTVCFTQLY